MPEAHPTGPSASGGNPTHGVITSAAGMDGATLSERVLAELVARDMTWSALQRAAKFSQKTIKDLKEGAPKRHWGHPTLNKIDAVFGLPKGTMYAVWDSEPKTPRDELAERVRLMEAGLAQLRDQPPWGLEAMSTLAPLSPDERSVLFTFVRMMTASRR